MDNYELKGRLGKGTFGEVFLARVRNSGQLVALKRMTKRGRSAWDLNNLRKEILVMKKLRHENIIQLSDWFETQREIVIITELGQGELGAELDAMRGGEVLDLVTMRSVARQLVSAFHYLHHHRILHRDIKPANILIGPNGKIKLGDFGFARPMSENTFLVNSIKGSPIYMAPELVQGHPYNEKADLWSMGIVLYECATGIAPFSRGTVQECIELIVKAPVDYTMIKNTDLANLLKGLLSKNPAKRLGWPHLLSHPFLQQTEDEKMRGEIDTLSVERQRLLQNIRFEQTTVLAEIEDGLDSPPRPPPIDAAAEVEEEVKEPGSPVDLYVLFAREQSRKPDALKERLRDDKKMWTHLFHSMRTGVADPKNPFKVQVTSCNACLETVTNIARAPSGQPVNGEMDNFHLGCLSALGDMIKNLVQHLRLQFVAADRNEELLGDVLRTCKIVTTEAFKTARAGIHSEYPTMFIKFFRIIRSRQSLAMPALEYMNSLVKQAGLFPKVSLSFYASLHYYKTPVDLVSSLVDVSPDSELALLTLAAILFPKSVKTQSFPFGDDQGFKLEPAVVEMAIALRVMTADAINERKPFPALLQLLRRGDSMESALKVLYALRTDAKISQWLLESAVPLLVDIALLPITDRDNDEVVAQALSMMLLGTMGPKCFEVTLNKLSVPKLFDLLRSSNLSIHIAANHLLLHYSTLPQFREPIFLTLTKDEAALGALLRTLTAPKGELVMTDLDGCGSSFPEIGLMDGPVRLLSSALNGLSSEAQEPLLVLCRQSGLLTGIEKALKQIRTTHPFSLVGFSATLDVLSKVLPSAYKAGEAASGGLIQAVASLFHKSQLQLIRDWSVNHGGGKPTAILIFQQALNILSSPFLCNSRVTITTAQTVFYNEGTIRNVVKAMMLCEERELALPLGFIRCVVGPDLILTQFLEMEGLQLIPARHLLLPSQPLGVLVETLEIIRTVARSPRHALHLHALNVYPELLPLLKHTEPEVRISCCQTIGHLCSQLVYCGHLSKSGIFGCLIQCCKNDPNELVRQLSCQAISSALTQEPALLATLTPGIPNLVSGLQDQSLAVRAAAASALGCYLQTAESIPALNEAGAIKRLLDVVQSPEQGTEFDIVLTQVFGADRKSVV